MANLGSYRERRAQERLTAPEAAPARIAWRGPLIAFGVLLAVVIVWELGSRLGLVKAVFLPAPTVILARGAHLSSTGEVWRAAALTLLRAGLGVAIIAVPAIALGLLMGMSMRARAVGDPIVAAAHAIPKIAILPLILVALGIGEQARIFIAALGAFFPLLISTMAGARQISPSHFDAARNYGASQARLFTRVLLPGSLPSVMNGVRLGFNTALLLTIAAEMVMPKNGLGAIIWLSWETMRTEDLYVALIAIVMIGVGVNALLHWASARLAPWQGHA